jgi:hypothetical protein
MIYSNTNQRCTRQRRLNRIRKRIIVSAPFPCLVREAESFGVALLVRGEKELLLDEWLLRGATEQEARAACESYNKKYVANKRRIMEEQTGQYAIVELFGHKTVAGCVTKDTALFPLLRIDVLATDAAAGFTVEYGPGAIYGITYVSEEVARRVAQQIKVNPIIVYSPDLVTREAFERMKEEYRKRITDLRALLAGYEGQLEDDSRDDAGDSAF